MTEKPKKLYITFNQPLYTQKDVNIIISQYDAWILERLNQKCRFLGINMVYTLYFNKK